jgi:hypothetical protein
MAKQATSSVGRAAHETGLSFLVRARTTELKKLI